MSAHRIQRNGRVDSKELMAYAVAARAHIREQEPHVNWLTGWLNVRKAENGFGDDFEITLKPRQGRGAK